MADKKRPGKRELLNPKIVTQEENHHIGRGYFIPHGYDAQQVRELYYKWNKILQNSGHTDIEVYSSFMPGRSSPRLRMANPLNPDNAGQAYISSLIDTYLNHFTYRTVITETQKRFYSLDKFLLQCFSSGIHLGILVKFFKSVSKRTAKTFVLEHNLQDVNLAALVANKGRSKFWIYYRTRSALTYCYAWHLSDINGELTEELVNQVQLHGLDSKDAEKIINRVRKRSKLEPISLKWAKKSY